MNQQNRGAKAKLVSLVARRGSSAANSDRIDSRTTFEALDPEIRTLVVRYAELLGLSLTDLSITTNRREFEKWLGRRVGASIGGAYVFLAKSNRHAILINLPRIDRAKPRSVELIVAEELIHMRDHLDGD